MTLPSVVIAVETDSVSQARAEFEQRAGVTQFVRMEPRDILDWSRTSPTDSAKPYASAPPIGLAEKLGINVDRQVQNLHTDSAWLPATLSRYPWASSSAEKARSAGPPWTAGTRLLATRLAFLKG